jgi:hypothetical protein
MVDTLLGELVAGPNFGTLTTLLPSGHPQTHVMWVDADDTPTHRAPCC